MIWEAVVNYVRDGRRYRHIARVEADTIQEAREKLLAEYGPESINISPRIVPET